MYLRHMLTACFDTQGLIKTCTLQDLHRIDAMNRWLNVTQAMVCNFKTFIYLWSLMKLHTKKRFPTVHDLELNIVGCLERHEFQQLER